MLGHLKLKIKSIKLMYLTIDDKKLFEKNTNFRLKQKTLKIWN